MKNPAPAPAAPENSTEPAAGGNMEQVRELLFGTQIRDLESRFRLAEERILKETAEMRDDIRRRFDTLEHFIKKETQELGSRLDGEMAERRDATAELKQTAAALEERVARLDQHTATHERELRQLILEEVKKLSEEIRTKHEDVTTQLRNETRELRGAKADRATLGSLLADMAIRINGGTPAPDGAKRD